MNKSEIIDSIAYAGIPSGTKLVEHSNPTLGITVAKFIPANADGLKILAARILADQLQADTADLPEVPDAAFFLRLHSAVINFHRREVDACCFESVEEVIIGVHRIAVEKIRHTANKLKIVYREPVDPLLD